MIIEHNVPANRRGTTNLDEVLTYTMLRLISQIQACAAKSITFLDFAHDLESLLVHARYIIEANVVALH